MKTTPAWECSCSAGLLRLFLKLSFQPQSAIRAWPLHVLRMGGRDAILLPGDGPGAPGASSGAAGRHPQARFVPAASSPGRLSLPTTSHSKWAVAQIRFCKQKSCQLIRRWRARRASWAKHPPLLHQPKRCCQSSEVPTLPKLNSVGAAHGRFPTALLPVFSRNP